VSPQPPRHIGTAFTARGPVYAAASGPFTRPLGPVSNTGRVRQALDLLAQCQANVFVFLLFPCLDRLLSQLSRQAPPCQRSTRRTRSPVGRAEGQVAMTSHSFLPPVGCLTPGGVHVGRRPAGPWIVLSLSIPWIASAHSSPGRSHQRSTRRTQPPAGSTEGQVRVTSHSVLPL